MMDSRMNSTVTSARPSAEIAGASHLVEVSVVIPCLNEAESLAFCLDKAMKAFRAAGLSGEVIVADNGSTDGSIQIAEEHGARVIRVPERGYGAALRAGIAASRGPFIIMGDADDSYDFTEVPRFVEKLREGHDIVMGNRFAAASSPGRCRGSTNISGIPASPHCSIFFSTRIGDSYRVSGTV